MFFNKKFFKTRFRSCFFVCRNRSCLVIVSRNRKAPNKTVKVRKLRPNNKTAYLRLSRFSYILYCITSTLNTPPLPEVSRFCTVQITLNVMSTLAAAASRMNALEEKISELEASRGDKTNDGNTAASNEALFDYQAQLLERLSRVRDALSIEGGDIGQIKAERDLIRAENIKLKMEAEKLNYRVKHLVKALIKAEEH
jgi:hypothetical protein